MPKEERKKIILQMLEYKGIVAVNDIASQLKISVETVRRYLTDLEKERQLKRIYGGAVRVMSAKTHEPALYERVAMNAASKERIAYQAAQHIHSGDTIVIGEGSTTLQLINYVQHLQGLTIITSSFALAEKLMEAKKRNIFLGEVIFLGGYLNVQHARIEGTVSRTILKQFNVDKAFITADALTLKEGLTCYSADTASLSALMLQHASQSYVLADATKFDQRLTHTIAPIHAVNFIFSNKEAPVKWQASLKNCTTWVTC